MAKIDITIEAAGHASTIHGGITCDHCECVTIAATILLEQVLIDLANNINGTVEKHPRNNPNVN